LNDLLPVIMIRLVERLMPVDLPARNLSVDSGFLLFSLFANFFVKKSADLFDLANICRLPSIAGKSALAH